MRNHHRIAARCLYAVLILSAPSWAAPVVLFNTSDVGGGLVEYNLAVDNSGGSESLSGLLVLNGNSVFGLDATSEIGAPADVGGNPVADWSFFAPLPPFVDILFYFSLNAAADIPIDGSLGGFFFKSTIDPATLGGNDFAVEGIGAISGSEIPLGNARLAVPEPPVLLLLIMGTGFMALVSARQRARIVKELWSRKLTSWRQTYRDSRLEIIAVV